jgi:hypothetical protein
MALKLTARGIAFDTKLLYQSTEIVHGEFSQLKKMISFPSLPGTLMCIATQKGPVVLPVFLSV